MLLNGCRIGELAGLTISDYHKETRSLDIHTSFNRYIPENEGSLVTELPTSLIEKWKSLTRYWN